MAAVHGRTGVVKAGATPTTLGEVVNWTYNITREETEVSRMNTSAKEYLAGLKETSLTLTVNWDPADTGADNIISAFNSGGTVDVELFPNGEGSGKTAYTGTVTPLSVEHTADAGSIVQSTFSARGELTESIPVP